MNKGKKQRKLERLIRNSEQAMRSLRFDVANRVAREAIDFAETNVKAGILPPTAIKQVMTGVGRHFTAAGDYQGYAELCKGLQELSGNALNQEIAEAHMALGNKEQYEHYSGLLLQGAHKYVVDGNQALIAARWGDPERAMAIMKGMYTDDRIAEFIANSIEVGTNQIYRDLIRRHLGPVAALAMHGNYEEAREAMEIFYDRLVPDFANESNNTFGNGVEKVLKEKDPDGTKFHRCAAGEEFLMHPERFMRHLELDDSIFYNGDVRRHPRHVYVSEFEVPVDANFAAGVIKAWEFHDKRKRASINSKNTVYENNFFFFKFSDRTDIFREEFVLDALVEREIRPSKMVLPFRSGDMGLVHSNPLMYFSYFGGETLEKVLPTVNEEKRLELLVTAVLALADFHAIAPEQYTQPRPTKEGSLEHIAKKMESMDGFTPPQQTTTLDALGVLAPYVLKGEAVPCKDASTRNFGAISKKLEVISRFGDDFRGKFDYTKSMGVTMFDFETMRWNTPHDDIFRLIQHDAYLTRERMPEFWELYFDRYNHVARHSRKRGIKREGIRDLDSFMFEGYAHGPHHFVGAFHNPLYQGKEYERNRRYWMQEAAACLHTLGTEYRDKFTDFEMRKISDFQKILMKHKGGIFSKLKF